MVSRYRQYISIVQFEFYRHIVRKRIIIMLIVMGLSILLPIIVRYALNIPYPSNPEDMLMEDLDAINTVIILAATFFAGDALVSEYERRTGYILFPNPLRREIIFIGKLSASFLVSEFFVTIYYLVEIAKVSIIYGTLPYELLLSYAYAALYTLAVIGLAYILNVTFRSTIVSTLLTFFFLFMIFPVMSSVLMLAKIEPWFILTYCGDIITLVFNPPKERIVEYKTDNITIYIYYPDFATSILVMLIYAATTLTASLFIFKRRELKE